MDVHSNFNMSVHVCIRPYQQWAVVGWPQGCVPGRGLLFAKHTLCVLLVAKGLAWGGDGWDI